MTLSLTTIHLLFGVMIASAFWGCCMTVVAIKLMNERDAKVVQTI